MGSQSSSMASSSKPKVPTEVKRLVDSTIDQNFVAIFSKTYCPYCKRAKALINSLGIPEGKTIKVYELDERADGTQIQNYLFAKTGQSTVPNIFINREHMGGSDDLAALHKAGKLEPILKPTSA